MILFHRLCLFNVALFLGCIGYIAHLYNLLIPLPSFQSEEDFFDADEDFEDAPEEPMIVLESQPSRELIALQVQCHT